MDFYTTPEEREAAVAAGETTLANSTLTDGHAHYAIVRYFSDGRAAEIAVNLTGSPHDDVNSAACLAEIRDRSRHRGVAGYGAERIA